jgi:hypothetical protein
MTGLVPILLGAGAGSENMQRVAIPNDWRDGSFDDSDACRQPSIYALIKRFVSPRDDETAWLSKTLAIRSAFQSAE